MKKQQGNVDELFLDPPRRARLTNIRLPRPEGGFDWREQEALAASPFLDKPGAGQPS